MAELGPEAKAAKYRIESAWNNREQTGLTAEGLRDLIKDEIRALSVDLPAGKQHLLYGGFMAQAGALSERAGSFVGVIQDTHAGQLVNELDAMDPVREAVIELRIERGADYGVANFVQYELGSPADLASARFAEKASGGAYMLATNALVGDTPATSSILHRTEMKIFLGQNVEIDGKVYSNQNVTSVNGIRRETLLGEAGERPLSDAEYGKAFDAVQAVSRAQVNFIAKAIGLELAADGNISSSNEQDIKELTRAFAADGFEAQAELLGRASEKFFSGDLDKMAALPHETGAMLKALRGGLLYGDTLDGNGADGNPLNKAGPDAPKGYMDRGAEHADTFWYWPGTFIMDAGAEDRLTVFGLPLTGGTNAPFGLPRQAGSL